MSSSVPTIWNPPLSSSTGFDGYRTLTTAPPEQLLFFVTGLVVLFVLLSVSNALTQTIQQYKKKTTTTTLTGRTATMTTTSSTASGSPRDHGPQSVTSASPPQRHAPQPSFSVLSSQQQQHMTNNNNNNVRKSKSVLMWGSDTRSVVSHSMSDTGGTSAILSQQQQQQQQPEDEIMIDDEDEDDDNPSVTHHHSNMSSRQQQPHTTTTTTATTQLTAESTTMMTSWWQQQPHKVHQGELLFPQHHSVLSAPLPPRVFRQRQQQSRAVLSEAGSMLLSKGGGDDNNDPDEEEGVIVVDEDDFVIRSSSLPMLRHRNHQAFSAHNSNNNNNKYYDVDDDDDDIGTVILSSSSSVMPPLSPDAVVPEDAADAHDTGLLVHYPSSPQPATIGLFRTTTSKGERATLLDTLLEVAKPTVEHRRFVCHAILLPALIEPAVRLVHAALIAWWLGTPALVAYVLVHWMLGSMLTKDIIQAMTDVESNLVKDSILLVGGDDGLLFAGQSMQLALWLQGILSMGILALVCYTGILAFVVEWLLGTAETEEVAATYRQAVELAGTYAKIILWDVWIRNTSKTLFLPLHMMNQGQFEYFVDAGAALATCIAVVVLGLLRSSDELLWFGWIQVAIGVAALCWKLAFVKVCELSAPYEKGFFASVTLFNPKAVVAFLSQVAPLFVGSLLERREWDVFVVLISVVTWALLGIVWEICTSSAEALGEAAGARISFYLMSGFPIEASLLAKKVVLFAVALSLALASSVLLLEPMIALLLTPDATLEHLVVQLVGVVVLAYAAMVFAQIFGSLLGAMGKFAKATAIMLVARWLIMFPLSLLAVFAFRYDLRAVVGSVAMGYGTAACLSGFAADWRHASWESHQASMNANVDGDDDGGNVEKQTVDHQSHFYDDGSFYSVSDVETWEEHQKDIADSVTMGTTVLSSQSTERMIF